MGSDPVRAGASTRSLRLAPRNDPRAVPILDHIARIEPDGCLSGQRSDSTWVNTLRTMAADTTSTAGSSDDVRERPFYEFQSESEFEFGFASEIACF